SFKYGVPLNALIAANPTINPNLIFVGQQIVIP
ncbi:MAG: LysM peptidoglycan-binding domain-containing protein, partial [Chloroflexi bacterium]|nr:LysM peptidoglycan-binding domain-containing protein [Chloroflexota bacterium]